MNVRLLNGCMALMLTGVIITSCEKRNIYNPDEDIDQPQGEYFDFSTSQKVKMNISYEVPEGYRVAFDVYDQLPMVEVNGQLVLNTELNPIASGITDGYGKYDLEKVLPAAIKEFYVYTPDLFATTLLHGTILGNNATLESVELSDLRTKAVTTKASSESGDWVKLGNWTEKGKPNYFDDKNLYVYESTLSNIKNNFPDTKKVNSIYYTKNDLYVAEDAEMWLTVLSSVGVFNNSLGYYCYTGKIEDQNPKNLKKILAIPCAKKDLFKGYDGRKGSQYKYVKLAYPDPETGELKTKFPKGTTIGFVLISDGFNKGTINYGNTCFYSYPAWNPEKGNNNHMILFRTKNYGEEFVAFGFEDQSNDTGDKDCNDVMFHVIANPIGSITEEIPEVPDKTDEDVYKDEVYRGTLAFEDLWPMQGDYDLNDVVVKYKSTATTVVKSSEDYASYGKVIKVKDEFSLVWSGALYRNGFGYQMSVDKSNVKSLKVTRNGEELATAWDKDLDKVTIMLSDDILSEIGESTGNVVNYTVELEFAEPILVKEFNEELAHAPYNPFIVAKGGLAAGRVEVHLPMYAPTAKNNMELLGTGDDKSDVALNRYYVSGQEFPFAIHIFGENDFINKEEGIRIDEVYPRYINWVEKLGQEDTDWYKYPKN